MKVLVLNEHEVTELLTLPECIGAMETALAALARGEVHNPLRQAIRAPGAPGLLGLMPAWWNGPTPYYGLKEVCVFPENPKRGLDTHVGTVILRYHSVSTAADGTHLCLDPGLAVAPKYPFASATDLEAAKVRGKVEVAREVIEAVDNLERALEAADGGEGLAAGVEMVLGGLRETLARHGVEAVDPKGEKFDPNRHEALSTQPAEGTESGTVVEVLQKGYTLGEQLIRPARVVVSA